MSLNRKHFDRIAAAAKANRRHDCALAQEFLCELADILAEASGTFDRRRFFQASGYDHLNQVEGARNGTPA